jgi:hypothetical protein
MSTTSTASATSLNFIGFDDMHGNGTAPILYNRVVILPKPRETAGKWVHPVAGYLPGQQPYIKAKVQVWNRSNYAVSKRLAKQGFSKAGSAFY